MNSTCQFRILTCLAVIVGGTICTTQAADHQQAPANARPDCDCTGDLPTNAHVAPDNGIIYSIVPGYESSQRIGHPEQSYPGQPPIYVMPRSDRAPGISAGTNALVAPADSSAAQDADADKSDAAYEAVDPTKPETTDDSPETKVVSEDAKDDDEADDKKEVKDLEIEPGPFWSVLPNRDPGVTSTGSPAIFAPATQNRGPDTLGSSGYNLPSSSGLFLLGGPFGFGANNGGFGGGGGGGGGGFGAGGGGAFGGGGGGGGNNTVNGSAPANGNQTDTGTAKPPGNSSGVFTDPPTPGPQVPPSTPTTEHCQEDSSIPDSPSGTPAGTPVVPEPGSLLLLAVGGALGGTHWFRRRKISAADCRC